IGDLHVPDVRRASAVEGDARGGQHAVALGAEVVGVDLESEPAISRRAGKEAPDAGDRLREGNAGAAVQMAEDLDVTWRYRHRGDNALGRQFLQFDIQCFDQTAARDRGDRVLVHAVPFRFVCFARSLAAPGWYAAPYGTDRRRRDVHRTKE